MTYRGDVPLALFKNTETGASSVIAASSSSYNLNCQQCDYKSSCQSHMRQRVKNVHERFKYDCTSCDYNNGVGWKEVFIKETYICTPWGLI